MRTSENVVSGTGGAACLRVPDLPSPAQRTALAVLGGVRRGGGIPGDVTDVSTPGPPPYRKVVAMTSASAAATRILLRARTGGPKDDRGPKLLEHVLGWTLVVLLAVFVTRAGLM